MDNCKNYVLIGLADSEINVHKHTNKKNIFKFLGYLNIFKVTLIDAQ